MFELMFYSLVVLTIGLAVPSAQCVSAKEACGGLVAH